MKNKIARCFMNGKSCIYERTIDETLEKKNKNEKRAFVIMPYDEKFNTLYHWELVPFLKNGGKGEGNPEYKCIPERADDISRVGYIICEKICKRIQEADLVVVDLSYHNANVYYELGLAIALRKEILPICIADTYQVRSKEIKEKLGISKVMQFGKFEPIEQEIKDFLLDYNNYEIFRKLEGNKIFVFAYSDAKPTKEKEGEEKNGDTSVKSFKYNFMDLCKSAAGNAVAEIFTRNSSERQDNENNRADSDTRHWLRYYSPDDIREIQCITSVDLAVDSFQSIVHSVKNCGCILIDISKNVNTNYFWLGYIHGIGGNVIPINGQSKQESCMKCFDTSSCTQYAHTQNVVAFDIRALWHVIYNEQNPIELSASLKDILEFIYKEKAVDKNRRTFWSSIIADAKVSIFLGSCYLEELGRNSIGDWDYRTAAEITSFLTSQKETMKVTLASPQPKNVDSPTCDYANWLRKFLEGQNCIIVASADVNDLTEVALCEIYKLEKFREIQDSDGFTGFIAYKTYANQVDGNTKKEKSPTETEVTSRPCAFYVRNNDKEERRGFIFRDGIVKMTIDEHHRYPHPKQEDKSHEIEPKKSYNILLGQLVVAQNPVSKDKKVIIISGISGPATFGIAQMLTGCMYEEFTINNLVSAQNNEKIEKAVIDFKKECLGKTNDTSPAINYADLSEDMLLKFLSVLEKTGDSTNGCMAIVNVGVYYPEEDDNKYSNDDRKIIGWNFRDLKVLGAAHINPEPIQSRAIHQK